VQGSGFRVRDDTGGVKVKLDVGFVPLHIYTTCEGSDLGFRV
jgi:hypothetical protein